MSWLIELLEDVLQYIYQLPPQMLAVSAAFASLIYCGVHEKCAARRWLRPCIGLVMGCWFAVVLWTTVLNRSSGGAYDSIWIPLHTYWRVLCGENRELLRSAFMNAALFYPAGLLLGSLMPEKWSYRKGMLCTLLLSGLFSLYIELHQYFAQLGNAEIDDVLHNTLGALAGYAAFHAFSRQ